MEPYKSVPEGYTRIASSIYYDDPIGAIDWLCAAFGFETRLKYLSPEGKLQHSELIYGEDFIMVGDAGNDDAQKSPNSIGKCVTQAVHIYVDDINAHCERARQAGAIILKEPDDRQYGNRVYMAEDCEGHRWWFAEAQVKSFDEGVENYKSRG